MIDQNELMGLLAFFRHSRYDMLQTQTVEGDWGPGWTFPPCDVLAAQKAARMMRRMGISRIRHARRARLRRSDGVLMEAIVVTALPSRQQTVISIEDRHVSPVSRYLTDDCLDVLGLALAVPALEQV